MTSGLANSAMLPNVEYPSSVKLQDRWNGAQSDEYPQRQLSLPGNQDFDYELAARWTPKQLGFYAESMNYVLKKGINKDKGFFSKSLGYLGLLVAYKYRVSPTFFNGKYTRSDVYSLAPTLDGTFDIVRNDNLIAKAGILPSFDLEFGFYRQFASPKEALLATPYMEDKMPLDAKTIKEKLAIGDLFRYQSKLNILLKTSLRNLIGAGVSPYFVATGNFEVIALKLPENKIRLTTVMARNHTAGITAGVDFEDQLKLVNVSFVDGIIEQVLGTNVASAKFEKEFSKNAIFDAVIDLKDPKAAQAYNETMKGLTDYQYMGMVLPQYSDKEVLEGFMLNTLPLQNLLNNQSPSVKNLIQGQGDKDRVLSAIKIGNQLMEYSTRSESQKMELKAQEQEYKLNLHTKGKSFKILYSLFERNKITQEGTFLYTNGLEKSQGIVFNSIEEDKTYDREEIEELRDTLKSRIPLDFFSPVLSRLESVETNLNNVYVKNQIIFDIESFKQYANLKEVDISSHLKSYMNAYALSYPNYHVTPGQSRSNVSVFSLRNRDLRKFTNAMELILSSKASAVEKSETLLELRDSKLFNKVGIGFLISLIPEDKINDVFNIYFELNSTSDKFRVKYSNSNSKNSNAFDILSNSINMFAGEKLNLRLYFDSLPE